MLENILIILPSIDNHYYYFGIFPSQLCNIFLFMYFLIKYDYSICLFVTVISPLDYVLKICLFVSKHMSTAWFWWLFSIS